MLDKFRDVPIPRPFPPPFPAPFPACGGAVKVIASIDDPSVIKKILDHLDHLERRAEAATPVFRPFARAPPQQELPSLTEPDRADPNGTYLVVPEKSILRGGNREPLV